MKNKIFKEIELTKEQQQVLIGGIMGDSHLKMRKYAKNASGDIAHSLKQEEYLIYKYNILKEFCSGVHYYKNLSKQTGKIYNKVYTRLNAHPILTDLYNISYESNGNRIISKELLSNFDEQALAILFMDDGFKSSSGGYAIALLNYKKECLEQFSDFLLKKWGIITSIHSRGDLYIYKKSVIKFEKLITPYILSSMEYKIHKSSQ
jgi:hypothetical protein